jgi:hypothetical protein
MIDWLINKNNVQIFLEMIKEGKVINWICVFWNKDRAIKKILKMKKQRRVGGAKVLLPIYIDLAGERVDCTAGLDVSKNSNKPTPVFRKLTTLTELL